MYSVCACPWSYDHKPSHPYYAGTEHVGFSPTRQTLLAPSAKRREMFGESPKGELHPSKDHSKDGLLHLVPTLLLLDDSPKEVYVVFWRGHFKDSIGYYYVTASWAPCHFHTT